MTELRFSRRECSFCGEFADAWSDFMVPGELVVECRMFRLWDAYPICRDCEKRPRHILEAIIAAGPTPLD